MLVVVLCLSMGTVAFAGQEVIKVTETSAVTLDDGNVLETKTVDTVNGMADITSVITSNDVITERAVYYHETDEIVQEVFDPETGELVSKDVFIASEHYTEIPQNSYVISPSAAVIETTKGGHELYAPQETDYGLPNSLIFNGYKMIGQATDFGSVATAHRHIDSHVQNGSSFKFDFVETMTISTITELIRAAIKGHTNFAGITTAIISGMAKGFFSAIADGLLQGKLQVDRFHYTYKVTVDTSRNAIGSYCEYKDYYVSSYCTPSGIVFERFYELKRSVNSHNLPHHSIQQMLSAIQVYLNGDDPWSTVCSMGDR